MSYCLARSLWYETLPFLWYSHWGGGSDKWDKNRFSFWTCFFDDLSHHVFQGAFSHSLASLFFLGWWSRGFDHFGSCQTFKLSDGDLPHFICLSWNVLSRKFRSNLAINEALHGTSLVLVYSTVGNPLHNMMVSPASVSSLCRLQVEHRSLYFETRCSRLISS